MPYVRTRHGGNLNQYYYVQKKYGTNSVAQTFWMLIILLVGGLVALQLSETDAERKARAEKQEEDNLRIVCMQDKKACNDLREQKERRRQRCEIYGEDCAPNDE